jgi:predicted KAP-like P-loop ATPase
MKKNVRYGGESMLFSDRPLEDPEQDLLGYRTIAKRIAESILTGSFPNGFVIAVQGPWGSGKSTLLNFINFFLSNPEEGVKPPIVVRFNPWWFSCDSENILAKFFDQLAVDLKKSGIEWEKVACQILEISTIIGKWIPPLEIVANIGKWAQEKLKGSKDIWSLKEEVEKALQQLDHKVVVFVDDIDRLYPEEIRRLFAIIRTVADFPNTIYILALDRSAVAKSIENKGKGEDYLKKIIQAPVDLPLIESRHLLKALKEGIEKVFADTDPSLMNEDEQSVSLVTSYLVSGFPLTDEVPIKTLRDIHLLLNRLFLTYPIAKRNVVPSDFIAIEAISIFYPEIYDVLRNHSEKFVRFPGNKEPEKDKEFYDELFSNRTLTIRSLLQFLFPRVAQAYKEPEIIRGSSQKYEQSRIHNEAFPFYFCLTQTSWISNEEMNEILSYKEPEKIKERLLENYAPKITFFLERLRRGLVQELPSEELWPLAECLLKFGDDLIRRTLQQKIQFTSYILVEAILQSLSVLKDRAGYFEKIKDIFNNSESISILVNLVTAVDEIMTQDKTQSRSDLQRFQNLFSKEQLEELKKVVSKRIRDTKNTKIFETPELPMVLRYWHEWDKNSFDEWFEDLEKNFGKYHPQIIEKITHAFLIIANQTSNESFKNFYSRLKGLKERNSGLFR